MGTSLYKLEISTLFALRVSQSSPSLGLELALYATWRHVAAFGSLGLGFKASRYAPSIFTTIERSSPIFNQNLRQARRKLTKVRLLSSLRSKFYFVKFRPARGACRRTWLKRRGAFDGGKFSGTKYLILSAQRGSLSRRPLYCWFVTAFAFTRQWCI